MWDWVRLGWSTSLLNLFSKVTLGSLSKEDNFARRDNLIRLRKRIRLCYSLKPHQSRLWSAPDIFKWLIRQRKYFANQISNWSRIKVRNRALKIQFPRLTLSCKISQSSLCPSEQWRLMSKYISQPEIGRLTSIKVIHFVPTNFLECSKVYFPKVCLFKVDVASRGQSGFNWGHYQLFCSAPTLLALLFLPRENLFRSSISFPDSLEMQLLHQSDILPEAM